MRVQECLCLIDAMQQNGTTWDFASDVQPRYVKMGLCATATETGSPREDGLFWQELEPQRASSGRNGFPSGKDAYEGYGIVNPDAAVEAVSLVCDWNATYSDYLGGEPADRRAWARAAHPPAPPTSGTRTGTIHLQSPPTGDFDLYVYDSQPDPSGNPSILFSSTTHGMGASESVQWTSAACLNCSRRPPPLGTNPVWSGSPIIVVKRVSGYGSFVLTTWTDL
jgi:hypothetical protein